MEVHHHAEPHHKRKKFREYLFDFLMIFLAVTLGFFAETLREHFGENSRARILAKSLFEDVCKDTADLNRIITFSEAKIRSIEAARSMLEQPRSEWNDSLINFGFLQFVTANEFDKTQGTYEQLKNSGSLRYFKQDLVDLLNAYDVTVSRTRQRDDLNNKVIVDVFFPAMIKKINFEPMYQVMRHKPVTKPYYYNGFDDAGMKEVINFMNISQRETDLALAQYNRLLEQGREILASLKKEYD